MITLKSAHEVELIARAARVVVEALQTARALLVPGLATLEIDRAVTRVFERRGAEAVFRSMPGRRGFFPGAACVSVNDEIAHGVPGPRRLSQGDLVTVDAACRLDGWCADAAWTWPVGEINDAQRRLLAAGRGVLEAMIAELAFAESWSQIAGCGAEAAAAAGFRMIEGHSGHGIGRELHEDPQLPNRPTAAQLRHDVALKAGMVLAIEPAISAGDGRMRLAADEWTLRTADGRPAVHFEHTVALTADGPRVLTAGIE